MSSSRRLADRIRRGESIPAPLGALLSAATVFQRAGMWRRLHGPRVRVDARVISFGNLTAGGVGKTPAVIERARNECAAGRKVAVLTRGYGGESGPEPCLVKPGPPWNDAARRFGDEPTLIARLVPDALVIKAADRVAAARLAIDGHRCDTLILDDGYQYVRLVRDENILVIDAVNPFGNGHVLPRGILREPLPAMGRATHVILAHCDRAPDVDAVIAQVREHCPNIPIRKTWHAPARLWRVHNGEELLLDTLSQCTVTAVCGIGNPEGFLATLKNLGAHVTDHHAYPDHAPIPPDALKATATIVTTEKDAMRMGDVGEQVLALGVDLRQIG